MKTFLSRLILATFLGLVLLNSPITGQSREEPFHLINQGTGAAALGMGGAFVAVANDLSAIYWNPAGLSQLKGLHVQADYVSLTGNEDFAVDSNRRSNYTENYSLSGNQLQYLGISYQLGEDRFSVVPAFAWRRTSGPVSAYDLKNPIVGTGLGILVPYTFNVTVENTFSGGEDEYAFAFATRISKEFIVGGTWNLLSGGRNEQLNTHGMISSVMGMENSSNFLTRDEDISGNYFTVGLLFPLGDHFQVGNQYKFSYTRKVDLFEDRHSIFITNGITTERISNDMFHFEDKIPAEWSGGISFRSKGRFCASTSLTFSDWSDLSYPTLRNSALQSSLVQWRFGGEYLIQELGFTLRGGFFTDNQPYSRGRSFEEYEDSTYHGFSIGAGYTFKKAKFDFAYVRENGKTGFAYVTGGTTFREFIATNANFDQNRFYFGLELASKN